MAHVGSADETEARRQEEELWKRFIRDNLVDRHLALRYLDTLKKRATDGIQ